MNGIIYILYTTGFTDHLINIILHESKFIFLLILLNPPVFRAHDRDYNSYTANDINNIYFV